MTPRNRLLRTCYRTEFGRSGPSTYAVCMSLLSHVLALVALGEPRATSATDAGSRPFKMGCLVLWKHPPPSTSVITAKCDRSRSNVAAYYRTLASRLSEWLKVIGTDTDRSATYDFLL